MNIPEEAAKLKSEVQSAGAAAEAQESKFAALIANYKPQLIAIAVACLTLGACVGHFLTKH